VQGKYSCSYRLPGNPERQVSESQRSAATKTGPFVAAIQFVAGVLAKLLETVVLGLSVGQIKHHAIKTVTLGNLFHIYFVASQKSDHFAAGNLGLIRPGPQVTLTIDYRFGL